MSDATTSRDFSRYATAFMGVWVGLGVYMGETKGYLPEDFWSSVVLLVLIAALWIFFEVRVGFEKGVESQKDKAAKDQHIKEWPERMECGIKLGMTPQQAYDSDLRTLKQMIEAQDNRS